MEAYLDNSATTRVHACVMEAVAAAMTEDYGNPSAMHTKGIAAERYVREAKETLSGLMKVAEKEIFFTSGGTESNNIALIGAALANRRAGNRIITTQIEHPSVSNTVAYLKEQGFDTVLLPVDKNGIVRLEELQRAMTEDTILVSVMYVNNEIGAVEPIEEIAELVHSANPKAVFHVDGVQAFGKYRIYPKRQGIDLFSASGHKFHAPKGIGFLYKNASVKLKPVIFGGGQQDGMRPGTLNVPGIAGLSSAAKECYTEFEKKQERLYQLKELLAAGIQAMGDTAINGAIGEESAPHVLNASFPGVRSEVLLHALEERGIYVSAGSACSSHRASISPILKAIGADKSRAESALRFSLSFDTTEEEIRYTLTALKELLPALRRFTRR